MRKDAKMHLARGAHGGFRVMFRKNIHGRTLAVIAELYKQECYFITAYYEN